MTFILAAKMLFKSTFEDLSVGLVNNCSSAEALVFFVVTVTFQVFPFGGNLAFDPSADFGVNSTRSGFSREVSFSITLVFGLLGWTTCSTPFVGFFPSTSIVRGFSMSLAHHSVVKKVGLNTSWLYCVIQP